MTISAARRGARPGLNSIPRRAVLIETDFSVKDNSGCRIAEGRIKVLLRFAADREIQNQEQDFAIFFKNSINPRQKWESVKIQKRVKINSFSVHIFFMERLLAFLQSL